MTGGDIGMPILMALALMGFGATYRRPDRHRCSRAFKKRSLPLRQYLVARVQMHGLRRTS